MTRYEALPERVTVYGGAYGDKRLAVMRGVMPAGPRAFGSEDSEYVRADIHAGAVDSVNDALSLMEQRRSPSGQVQMGAARAAQVFELLRAAAGGQ